MSNDTALADLCARLFREPQRIVEAHRIKVQPRIALANHAHADILQLDLAIGCTGHWTTERSAIELDGATAAVFYPQFLHGYALNARRHDAELFSIKLRVSKSWAAIRGSIFPVSQRGIAGAQPLAVALTQLCRLVTAGNTLTAPAAACVAQVLCTWPRGTTSLAVGSTDAHELESALALVEERLSRPPTIEELAAHAHMSSRHLTRRMRALLGCSPHDYLTARRISRAKELLAHSGLSVTAVADALGFPSVHTFSRWFTREAKLTPRAYRQRPAML
jgi:AraC-like DNA-binding protein